MIVVMAVGHGLQEFVLLMGTTTAAVLSLNAGRGDGGEGESERGRAGS